MKNYFLIIFLQTFPYWVLYFAYKLKDPTILPEILYTNYIYNYIYETISIFTQMPTFNVLFKNRYKRETHNLFKITNIFSFFVNLYQWEIKFQFTNKSKNKSATE